MKYSGETSSIFLIDKLIKSFPVENPIKIAFLGYHDAMASPKEWNAITNNNPQKLINRLNSSSLINIHGREKDVQFCPTIKSWLSSVYNNRVSYDVFDFTKYEGSEIEHDFNYPIPTAYHNKYDLVLDLGTCEHIFNLPQTLLNILHMTKIDGKIYHGGPIWMLNHGFYSYNPTLFSDFYEDNGCSIEEMWIQSMSFYDEMNERKAIFIHDIPKHDRFNLMQSFSEHTQLTMLEYNLNVVLNKIDVCEITKYPIQHKYRITENWT